MVGNPRLVAGRRPDDTALHELVGELSAKCTDFALTTGIVHAHDGTLYLLYATGTADLTGLWRLRPGRAPQRISALPAAGLPNGLALDPRTRTLYITDSVLGTISSVPTTGGTPVPGPPRPNWPPPDSSVPTG